MASRTSRSRLWMPAICIILITLLTRECCWRTLSMSYPPYDPILPTHRDPDWLEGHLMIALEAVQTVGDLRVLVLGSSSGLCAFRTGELGSPLAETAWNCCSAGMVELDGQATLFDVYLRNHQRPELVVLVLHPKNLTSEVGRHQIRARLLATCGVENSGVCLLTSFERASRAARNVIRRLSGYRTYGRFREVRQQRWEQRGWFQYGTALKEVPKDITRFSDVALHDEQKALLLSFCDLARRHGSKVLVLMTPLMCEPGAEYRQALETAAASTVMDANGTLVWPTELMILPPQAFSDDAHYTSLGADEFTRAVRLHIEKVLKSNDEKK